MEAHVMVEAHAEHVEHQGRESRHARDRLGSLERVAADELPLLVRELTRFGQHLDRDRQLADVVKEPRDAETRERTTGKPERVADGG